jgi:Fe2+ transport system protein FeoA
LADLKPGDRARIESIETADPAVQRLMVLGVVEGAEVVFLRRSLGGDPLEIRIYGAAISLREEQARRFHVALKTRGDPRDQPTHGAVADGRAR